MNIYDFDNTIFKGDSSIKFIKYSLVRHPFKVIKCLFKALIKYLKRIPFEEVKGTLFSFVKDIKDFDNYLDIFINKNIKNIKILYLKQRQDNDVIISASYEFLVKSFCNKLNIKNVICSKYDIKKGIAIGKNNKGEEKINRLKEEYDISKVNNAYSDSLSDIPMFKIAKNAYLVKGEKLEKYEC